jgi:hypothetical protein
VACLSLPLPSILLLQLKPKQPPILSIIDIVMDIVQLPKSPNTKGKTVKIIKKRPRMKKRTMKQKKIKKRKRSMV